MATMYAPGGRRSAAPVVSPRAALTSAAISDDIVTQDLYKAMQMQETPVASAPMAPGAVGSQQAAINLADYIGSGTSIADFGPSGAISGGGASVSPASVGQAAATAGAVGQGLSALGILGNNLGMVQSGQTLGQAAVLGSAGASLAAGNPGQAAMTVAPMALSMFGVPGVIGNVAMTAANPTLGPVDVQAALVSGLLSTVAPPISAALSLGQLFGLPTIKGMMTPVETAQGTPVSDMDLAVQQANLAAEQNQIDPLDALMASTNAFGTAPSTQAPVTDLSTPASGVAVDTNVGIDVGGIADVGDIGGIGDVGPGTGGASPW